MPPREGHPALVLAGGKSSPAFAVASGAEYRALADINGWPMLRYVVRALRQAETIGAVTVVAPAAVPVEPEADRQVAGDGDIGANLLAGVAASPAAQFILIATADIPFLTPEAVDEYVRRCRPEAADCCYAAVPLEICEKRFPDMKRTALRTPTGAFTGGNVVFQRVETVERQIHALRQAHAARKNPLLLARLIGARNVLRFLLQGLTLEEIGAAASRLTGARCRLIISHRAEIGADVDRPEDLQAARLLLHPPAEN